MSAYNEAMKYYSICLVKKPDFVRASNRKAKLEALLEKQKVEGR